MFHLLYCGVGMINVITAILTLILTITLILNIIETLPVTLTFPPIISHGTDFPKKRKCSFMADDN